MISTVVIMLHMEKSRKTINSSLKQLNVVGLLVNSSFCL